MAIEGDIQAVLAALVDGRAYPLTAPDRTACPYAIYQVVSNTPEVTLEERLNTENRRVQLDVYDKTYPGVKTLEMLIKSAMDAVSFINTLIVSRETYETDTQLYRVSLDYSIWT